MRGICFAKAAFGSSDATRASPFPLVCLPREMSGAFSQHVSTLERTRQRMSTKLAELRMQRRAHAERDRAKQKRRKRAEEEQAATALVLLALTMPATDCLRSFLRRSGKDELSASDTDNAVAATVDRFLAMTTAQTVRLLEPRRAVEAARLHAAQAFSIEHGVHVWLAERNTAGGVAPVISSVLERRHDLSPLRGHAAGPRLQLGKWGYYKWVTRWRRKWRVSKARAHPRDVLETAVARKKAPDRL